MSSITAHLVIIGIGLFALGYSLRGKRTLMISGILFGISLLSLWLGYMLAEHPSGKMPPEMGLVVWFAISLPVTVAAIFFVLGRGVRFLVEIRSKSWATPLYFGIATTVALGIYLAFTLLKSF